MAESILSSLKKFSFSSPLNRYSQVSEYIKYYKVKPKYWISISSLMFFHKYIQYSVFFPLSRPNKWAWNLFTYNQK